MRHENNATRCENSIARRKNNATRHWATRCENKVREQQGTRVNKARCESDEATKSKTKNKNKTNSKN